MDMTLKTEEFYQNCLQLINQSQLPTSIVYFVLKSIFQEVDSIYRQQIQQELEERKNVIENQEDEQNGD